MSLRQQLRLSDPMAAYNPGLPPAPPDATRDLNVLRSRFRLPDNRHQGQAVNINADLNDVAREANVNGFEA